jgi:arsenate reductase
LIGPQLGRRALAELVGTAFLVAAIVGSGIAAARLSPGDTGFQLLVNAAATGSALVALILALGPVSGAHFNPVVTLADRALGGISTRDAVAYLVAQVAGGAIGAVIANVMFSLPAIELSRTARSGGGTWAGEVVATVGLLLVVFGLARSRRTSVTPFAVGAFIAAAMFFSSSTAFANPAVTFGRTLSNTFAGIAPASVPPFLAAQAAGATLAVALVRVLYPSAGPVRAARVPREGGVG